MIPASGFWDTRKGIAVMWARIAAVCLTVGPLAGMAGYKYARTPTGITLQIVLPPGTYVVALDRIVVPALQAPK